MPTIKSQFDDKLYDYILNKTYQNSGKQSQKFRRDTSKIYLSVQAEVQVSKYDQCIQNSRSCKCSAFLSLN